MFTGYLFMLRYSAKGLKHRCKEDKHCEHRDRKINASRWPWRNTRQGELYYRKQLRMELVI